MSLLFASNGGASKVADGVDLVRDHKGQKSLSSRDYCPNDFFPVGEDNPRMPNQYDFDPVHKRLRDRIAALGLNDRSASLQAGMSETYLRKLFERPGSRPGGKALTGLSRALNLSPNELLRESSDAEVESSSPIQRVSDFLPPIAVRGTVAGSHESGAFQFDGADIEYIDRPASLAGRDRVYALYVQGYSMAPDHADGDLRIIDPTAMVRPGDTVVVSVNDPDRGLYSVLGNLVRRGETVIIGKLNPPAEIPFFSKIVHSIHKVITP